MSPMDRSLSEPMMTFELQPLIAQLRADDSYQRTGRVGRTLARSGRLRLVLVVLNAGVEVGTHQADSPMTIQLVEGSIEFRINKERHELRAGQVLFFEAGEAHDIRAQE